MTTRVERRSGQESTPLDRSVLSDIVRRVAEVAKPERIVMFGSAARGTMGANSDVDLLVIKSGRFQRGRLVDAIYRNLRGAGAPVDLIVVTPEEVEQYGDDPCLVIAPALKEGVVVYGS
ncbi:MAG: nucleotidyltransferase domain-containing protein [Pirellulaceae bacterium]|jgi:predicted nucleotidyltransferase|nr:nucleotidyltransferase domain-containing protein [Pirellulaceae bacterium]